jgi:hypothetical protein
MDDDFYEPLSTTGSVARSLASLSRTWNLINATPLIYLGSALLALPLLYIAVRSNGYSSEASGDREKRTVWMVPYPIPIVGHWFQL